MVIRGSHWGMLSVVILLISVFCLSELPSVSDWPPVHQIYGQLGIWLAATGRGPTIIRTGKPLKKAVSGHPAVFSPRRMRQLAQESGRLADNLAAHTEMDCRNGAEIIVDTTRADLGRLTVRGEEQVWRLKQEGIVRAVIWDGAHHLPGLRLHPEVLILPLLTGPGGTVWVCHGKLTDAVRLKELLALLDAIHWDGWVFGIPRFQALPKVDGSLAHLVLQVIAEIPVFDTGNNRGSGDREGDHGGDRGVVVIPGRHRLYSHGELVLDPAGCHSGVLADAKKSGATRVWAAPANEAERERLIRECLEHDLALRMIGRRVGVSHILAARLFGLPLD